jgi:replicative DNA helicase
LAEQAAHAALLCFGLGATMSNQPEPSASQAPERTQKVPERLVPHSIEAEEAVLGAVLLYPEMLLELTSIVQPEDFYELKHRWIWEAMLALSERDDAVDLLTVTEELRQRRRLEDVGGSVYVAQLANNTPTYLYAETYAQVVRRAAIRRRLMEAAGKIADIARDEARDLQEAVSAAEVALFSVTDESLRQEIIPIEQAVNNYYRRLEELYLNQQEILGVPTRFTDLDKLLGGLQKSDLIIVAARPGVGKTSFLLSVMLNAARSANVRCAFFSLEMGNEQLVQRLYSIETGINSQRLRDGKLEDHEWDRFVEATSRLNRLAIFIDDTPGISVQQVRARCRRLKKESGLDLVIVDYLQLLSSGVSRADTNRVQEISYISRSLKEMARELKVPVLAAAQLSRAVEQRADKRPQLSDLRESGSIEQDSDVVIFLYRDELYNPNTEHPNQAEVIVAKHRNGPTGKISLYFRKDLTQFIDIQVKQGNVADF